jgi:MSHA biogenesis protein MshI
LLGGPSGSILQRDNQGGGKLLPMFKPGLAEGWCAVALGADRFDIARVRRPAGRRPELVALNSFQRSGDDVDALKRLRRELKLGALRCTTLLGSGDYRFVMTELPTVPEAEIKDAVRWRVKDMVDLPVDNATVDVLEIPGEAAVGRPRQCFAAVADNAVVGRRMELFDQAKLQLDAIDVPELAQRNVAALFEEPNRGLAMLSFDEHGGLLTFTYKGELYFVRNSEASPAQLASADGELRERMFERVALEVQRSLDTFDRVNSHIPVTRLLVLLPAADGFVDFMRRSVSVPVEVPDLTQVIDCAAIPELKQPARQAECLRVIGAALRED